MEIDALDTELKPGVIDQFLEQLTEKAFHLGLRVVFAALFFIIGVQLIKLFRKIVKKTLLRSRIDDGVARFIDSLVKFGLYLLLIFTISSQMGVDAASILAILGSAGVAVGLAIQGSLSNLAGGVLLLILKPFVTGDYIIDGQGYEGTVEAVDIFYTQLITLEHKLIVLPNGTLANGTIINVTRSKDRRIDIPVGIAYEEDIRQTREVIEAVLKNDPDVLKEKEIRVFVDTFGESSVNLNVRCWSMQENYWETKWRLTEAIKYALDDANIRIPFPQVDVHLDKT